LAVLTGLAGAKVNLYLHVGPLGDDGYHPIDSLMVFADFGDRLTLRPFRLKAYSVSGPFAGAAPMDARNLAVRSAQMLVERSGADAPGFHLHLEKVLPVSAGLGGGSADAAAALKLIDAALGLDLGPQVLAEIGLSLGADVPACLKGAAVVARGRGERLVPAPLLPPLHAVLVNPMVPVSTAAVFAAFDELPPAAGLDPVAPPAFGSVQALAQWLEAATRNDLEAPARAVSPLAGAAVDRLKQSPRAHLARMSGSGATAFALCADAADAVALAAEVAASEPGWWCRACRLG
jgi:4-diphosphocytidyl-2-C-methyl-D-erythritol kinase